MGEVPPSSGNEQQSPIQEALQRLSNQELVALEALLVGLSDEAVSLRGHETDSSGYEGDELRGHGVVDRVASMFRDFLGHLEFGPEDPECDPLYLKSHGNARVLISRVRQLFEELKSCRTDKDKEQVMSDIETEVANGLLGHSGTIDQEHGYDPENDPLTWRAREHAPKIALIIAGTMGATAVATSYYKHRRHKKD